MPEDESKDRSNSETSPPGGTPMEIIRLGLRHAPLASKFVLGALVVFAAATVILSWGHSLNSLIPAASAILVVGLLVALLARAVQWARIGWLGDALAIALVALVLGITCLFISSAFFGVPHQGAALLAALINLPDQAPTPPNQPHASPTPAKESDAANQLSQCYSKGRRWDYDYDGKVENPRAIRAGTTTPITYDICSCEGNGPVAIQWDQVPITLSPKMYGCVTVTARDVYIRTVEGANARSLSTTKPFSASGYWMER
jgi:hypothetical protein